MFPPPPAEGERSVSARRGHPLVPHAPQPVPRASALLPLHPRGRHPPPPRSLSWCSLVWGSAAGTPNSCFLLPFAPFMWHFPARMSEPSHQEAGYSDPELNPALLPMELKDFLPSAKASLPSPALDLSPANRIFWANRKKAAVASKSSTIPGFFLPWLGAHGRRCRWTYLNVAHDPCGLHPAGYVDCVAPDVIVRFPGSDDPRQNPSFVHALGQRHRSQQSCMLLASQKPPTHSPCHPTPTTELLVM